MSNGRTGSPSGLRGNAHAQGDEKTENDFLLYFITTALQQSVKKSYIRKYTPSYIAFILLFRIAEISAIKF